MRMLLRLEFERWFLIWRGRSQERPDCRRMKLLACQHYDIRDNRCETNDQLTTRVDHNDCFSMRWINHGVKKAKGRGKAICQIPWGLTHWLHVSRTNKGKRNQEKRSSTKKCSKEAKKWRAKSVSKQSKQMGRGKKANKKDRIRPHFLRQRLEKDNLPSQRRKNYMAGNTR